MNPIAKKKTAKPKTKAGGISVARQRPVSATASVIAPPIPAKTLNGVSARTENQKGYDEYLIYQQLKEEVGEFYPHPGLWLESPHPMLGGQTPLQLALSSPGGKEIVWNLIQMIKSGMFS